MKTDPIIKSDLNEAIWLSFLGALLSLLNKIPNFGIYLGWTVSLAMGFAVGNLTLKVWQKLMVYVSIAAVFVGLLKLQLWPANGPHIILILVHLGLYIAGSYFGLRSRRRELGTH